MIAEEDKHASSQPCIHWRVPLPEVSRVPTGVPKMVPCEHSNGPALDAVYMLDLKIAQDR